MLKKTVFIIFLFSVSVFLVISCFFSKDEEDDMPCMCFRNDSSAYIAGVRYRLTNSSTWTTKYFGETQSPGDGFNCAEGTFTEEIPTGYYDYEIFMTGGTTYRGWTNVPYNGGNIGFVVTSTTTYSLYGTVDDNCNQTGQAYTASQ